MEIYDLIKPYVLSFIPLFIAMGAFDFVPFVISLTDGMEETQRRKMVREGTGAAGLILITFLFVGKAIFLILGVTVPDFMMAGGLLLLILSIRSLLGDNEDPSALKSREISIVPLATPLIAGPAAMATTLILLNTYGAAVALVSIVLNCLCAWYMLEQAPIIKRLLGERGTRGISKVSYILLASIAVMMIRHGVLEVIKNPN
jgi:multiple antibiotic resistance protein